MRILPPRRDVETPYNLSGRHPETTRLRDGSVQIHRSGTAAEASAAFEEAYARVIAVGAATTEHMNALADATAAGVQPWQLRLLASVLAASPEQLRRRLDPTLSHHRGAVIVPDAATEEV